ncbi:hypothetical protein ACFOEZ_14665 [Tianweitania populi]|uniref:Uncharacterized protein n=1 Tax=Tianweitania populi TaxID=1607949 RepID=A0A8J3GLC5_9HYPH|nr:hypothetical protein [Tianweitania populi]GHD16885.1 hypothetical protein GCM10016234_25470 [Tianweitania populi]
MSKLQVQNSFEPYYAGRNTDVSKWTVRKKTGDRIDRVKVEHGADDESAVTSREATNRA